jgi:hypothetical protein
MMIVSLLVSHLDDVFPKENESICLYFCKKKKKVDPKRMIVGS